jgi:hypothetical protein
MASFHQLMNITSLLEFGYKVRLEDLAICDTNDLEYLLLNFPREMAELMKDKETDCIVEKIEYCRSCDDELEDKHYSLGNLYYCYGCFSKL